MNWDVMGGVARRNWARNPNAMGVAAAYNRENDNGDQITLPFVADGDAVQAAVDGLFSNTSESE
jgi:urocanate hydratase